MIISTTHGFICMRPWKGASTTLSRRLMPFNTGPIGKSVATLPGLGAVTKHIMLDQATQLPEWDDTLFRFVFVRNPYDRAWSGFVQRRARLQRQLGNEGSLKPAAQAELTELEDGFDAFLTQQERRVAKSKRPFGGYQTSYVYLDGVSRMDFVGLMEQFEKDFETVCERLDLPDIPKADSNRRSSGQSTADDPRSAAACRYLANYTPERLARVNAIYQQDFDAFGYEMLDPARFAPHPVLQ